ncbi:MAG: FAD-dependent oxidoreductase, partial [bacterium]
MPELSPEQIARNFEDIHPPFDLDEAIAESSRCLFCYDAPCTVACPTHIDVPSFIRKILTRNLKGSARTILEANIFGGTCARACPTEVLCEGACVLNKLNKKPIDIGRLQRVATDFVLEKGIRLFEPGPQTGKKVAIIGGGPAGLTCAHELAKLGHKAVVFEAREKAGGLNTYGIAGYKMTTEFSLQEVELVRQIGIEIRTNVRVGKDVKIEDLLRDYDAVFLGIGLGRTGALGIPGENLQNCEEALDFIVQTRQKPFSQCKVGRRVAVVGGGNTAVDVGTAARRLGAEEVL